MATNKAIKNALLKKRGITPQRLSQLTNARKRELPMSTEHAVYTIAFEHGIDIAKELDAEETAEVRRLVSALRSNGTMKPESKTPVFSAITFASLACCGFSTGMASSSLCRRRHP